MLAASAIAIFFVPMFFLVLEKLGARGGANEVDAGHDDESGDAATPPQVPRAPAEKPEND